MLMEIEIIEKSLKARIDLFKIYVTIIILLITGISGIVLSADETVKYFPYVAYSPIKLFLIIFGLLFLVYIVIFTLKSYIKISSLINKLEKL